MAFRTRHGRVIAFNCQRCEHTWAPRVNPTPTMCPVCKSRYWDRRRTNRQGLRPAPPPGSPALPDPRRILPPPKPRRPALVTRTITATISGIECQRCGHFWPPKTPAGPALCPACKSPRYYTPPTDGRRRKRRA